MKVIVDKMPDKNNQCLFCKRVYIRRGQYDEMCKLTGNPCDGVKRCDCLKPINGQYIKSNKKNIKFEDGDLAKIVANNCGHEFDIGTIVALEKHDSDYKAIKNGDYWWVNDDDLEPLSEDDVNVGEENV